MDSSSNHQRQVHTNVVVSDPANVVRYATNTVTNIYFLIFSLLTYRTRIDDVFVDDIITRINADVFSDLPISGNVLTVFTTALTISVINCVVGMMTSNNTKVINTNLTTT